MYVEGWRKEGGERERERDRGMDVVREGGGKEGVDPCFVITICYIASNYFPSPGGTLAQEASQTSTPLPHARVEQHG